MAHPFFESTIWIWTRRFLLLGLGIAVAGMIFQPRFTPRNAPDSLAAVGPLESLSPEERRFFLPGHDFRLLGPPRPGEWLSVFPERGQTWDQYRQAGFNRFAPPRVKLYLQPLGGFPEGNDLLQRLQAYTAAFFAAEVVVLPPADLASQSFRGRINAHTGQPQIRTGDILEWLKTRLPADAYCLTAVTMSDLYPDENWNFVFGQATLAERVGVFSFCRYDPASGQPRTPAQERLFLRRSCKVLAHEIGHMYGLYHCVHFHCLMNGSNSLHESDSRPMHECPVCLRKLWSNIGFPLAGRYRNLEQWYREAEFNDEETWISRRLSAVGEPGIASPSRENSPPPVTRP